MNKKQILQIIRVKPKEVKIVFFAFLFAFCIGAAQNILSSIPLAMFLGQYNSALLPRIYIATGITAFFVGIAFTYLERRVSIFHALVTPIALFSASLLLLWGLLYAIENPKLYIGLLIWALVIGSLLTSITMLLINQLFTLQQSKRFYGLLYGGLATGGALLGFGMDFFVNSIGPKNLILLAALILFLGFIMQFLIRKHAGKKLAQGENPEEAIASKVSLKSFKNKKYMFQVFLLTIIVYFIYYTFDLLLNTNVQERFKNETDMAVFFGMLNATYSVSALISGFIISGWILSRWGLIASLLLWPVGLLILMGAVLMANFIPLFIGLVFAVILVAAVFEVTIREAITEQSILLLFQPLRPAQRAWAQLKNEAIITPLSMSIIGAILLLVDNYFGVQLLHMSSIIIGLSLIAIVLIIFALKNGYLKLLVESLSKRVISNPQFTKLTKDSLNLLKRHLLNPYPEEAIYALQTIEKIDRDEFAKVLARSLDNPLEEVRTFSLRKIEHYRIKSFKDQVTKFCLTEKNPTVLGAALLALGAIGDLGSFKSYLHDSNQEIAGSCIIAFIKYGSESEKGEAILLLSERAKSSKEEDRMMAANVIKQIDIPTKTDLLLALLRDVNMEVRVQASQATAHTKDQRLYDPLIENLGVAHVHDAAMHSLTTLGKPLVDYLIKKFDIYTYSTQINIVNLLGFIKDNAAAEFLQKLLPNSNRRLLHPLLLSLKRHSYKVTDEEPTKKLLIAENENILYLKGLIDAFNMEKMKILHDFLCREIELSQECCFLLLSFIYPESAILEAKQGLSLEDEDMHSNAIELLVQTLEREDQELFLAQLIFSPFKAEEGAVAGEGHLSELLVKIRDYTSNCFIPALSAAVVYTIGVLQVKNLGKLIGKQGPKDDSLLNEMRPWALKKLKIL